MAHITYEGRKYEIKNNTLDLHGRFVEDITDIEGLDQLTNLKILNLKTNEIRVIRGLDNLKNLRELYLSYNGISEIQGLDNLTNLEVLDISNPRSYVTYDRSGDDYLQSRTSPPSR